MNDDEFRALVEQAHQLEQLTRHPGWAVLVDWCEHQMIADKKAILNGFPKTYEDYLKVSHKLVGIHYVLDSPKVVNEMVARHRERLEEHREQAG